MDENNIQEKLFQDKQQPSINQNEENLSYFKDNQEEIQQLNNSPGQDKPQSQKKRARIRSKYTIGQRAKNTNIKDQSEMIQQDCVKNEDKSANLGMFYGVTIPCVQNIIGILLFLVQPEIVGYIGIGYAFLIVLMGVTTTFCTTLSMSAIVTNGKMKRGGTYYMISRSLGPAAGGSIGVLFMLANAFGAGMYLTGCYQIFFNWFPNLTFPGYDRIIGFLLLVVIYVLNMVGLKYVAKTGMVFLILVLLAIFTMYLGVIFDCFRHDYQNQPINIGIKGLSAQLFADNWGKGFTASDPNWFSDYFSWAIGLYFPAVTGVMAGCNRSGDLKDPSNDLPRGTLIANVFSSIVYLSFPILYGGIATREALIRAPPMTGNLAALIAWPSSDFTNFAIICASFGAGLQSLASAPRLMLAVAEDKVLPFLDYFGKNVRRPITFCGVLCFFVVMIVNLNYINPYLTMFFLMCYAIINTTCFVLTVQNAPNWRPRWKYYSKWQALLGIVLAFVQMFLISWYVALAAIGMMTALYLLIDYRVKKNWGDQISVFRYNMAIKAIIQSSKSAYHVKTWRPHFLAISPILPNQEISDKGVLSFVQSLEKGSGLRIMAYVLPGKKNKQVYEELDAAEDKINQYFQEHKIKNVLKKFIVSETLQSGYNFLIQSSGIGGINTNTVIMSFPENWKDGDQLQNFINTIDDATLMQQNIIVLKPQNQFEQQEIHTGVIDIWSFIYEKGLKEMFVYILQKSKYWKQCKVRLFVASAIASEDKSVKDAILKFLSRFRVLPKIEIQIINVKIQDVEQFIFGIEEKIAINQTDLKSLDNEKAEINKNFMTIDKEDAKINLNSQLLIQKAETNLAQKFIENRRISFQEEQRARNFSALFRSKNQIMEAAENLNKLITSYSAESDLVITNLPDIIEGEELAYYMYFCEKFTSGLKRVMLVRNNGKEVITEYT